MVKRSIKHSVYLLCLLTSNSAMAETLNEVFVKVLESNPIIIASRESVNVSYEAIKQARSSFLPTIAATGSMSKTDTNTDTGNDSKYHPKIAGVNITQNLFSGGKNLSGYRSARDNHAVSKANHDNTIQNTLSELVGAYVNVLTSTEVLELQEKQVELLTQQFKSTQSRFKQGELTKTDIKQAEARLASAAAKRIQASGSSRTAKTYLANLTGETVSNLTWPTITFSLPRTYTEELKNKTLQVHPNVIATRSTVASKKNSVANAKSGHYPSLNAVASYTHNRGSSSGDYDNNQVGLELSLPLFSGGKIISTVRSALASKEQALQNHEQTKRDVTENLVNAIELHNTALAGLKAFEKAEKATEFAESGVQREHKLGEQSVLDLLDARQELLEARVNLAQSKGDVIIQAYNLLSAMGMLNSKNIN